MFWPRVNLAVTFSQAESGRPSPPAGRALALSQTGNDGEWLIDLTGDAITWRRAHDKAAGAVRGPLTDLLLVIYKRRHRGLR